MELGAICCTPRAPACNRCPLLDGCFAAANHVQEELPRKKPKAILRKRYFHYLILRSAEKIFLNKRIGKDIWKALYEFPLIETEKKVSASTLLRMQELKDIVGTENIEIINVSGPYKHKLSHQTILAYFYHFKLSKRYRNLEKEFVSVTLEALPEYAFPRLISRYLEENDFLG